MKLIVGLGNPGVSYKWTRHNVGFEAIDKLAYNYNINVNKSKFKSVYGEGVINSQKVILVKPLTYMNLSGEAIKEFMAFFKDLNLSDLIVICDDVNINIGSIRIKPKGSAGGQNGLKNIIYNLNSDEFARIRIGVGMKPEKIDLADFVLSKFKDDENDFINSGITACTSALEIIFKDGNLNGAMNMFNKKNLT